jgi:hypothetical protein
MATAFTNFTYEADVLVGPVGNAGLIFRVSKPDIGADAYCGYYAGIDAADSELQFGYANNGWHSITNVPMTFAANTFYHLKVQAQGSRIRIYVTDTNQPVLDVQDSNFTSGMLGVRDYCTDGNQSLSSFSHLTATESAAGPQFGELFWNQDFSESAEFNLNFSGSANVAYNVWASSNLIDWTKIGPATEASPGQYEFIDKTVTNWLERFYRVSTL